MSRNRIPRPRGGRNSGKHAEMVIFNPTPGTPICQGSELHLWSELLPLIVKLYSLGLAQDSKPSLQGTIFVGRTENGPKKTWRPKKGPPRKKIVRVLTALVKL